ncbi:hypothetical protein [Pseudooceanicola nanhaiensis]|uniref:hypothetical protein n=1 Tax=Pseudooceanicola nanhaiensis TaxID=375761 RepID=UPI001CD5590E|nr:hypothetical protein [Pseudooceanicola nanhaiensis]MCA0919498.1 hypothetical protein [Pseudooceanicola nanhaiensis]
MFREEHELHKRRWGRNLGLGIVLAIFVALVFGLTVVKVSLEDFRTPAESGGEK